MDKYLICVCGPNGAGKSTFIKSVLSYINFPIVDPDLYSSQGISEIVAGKVAVRLINDYLAQGISFIKESTLTSNFDLRKIQEAKYRGYKNILIYLSLPSVEESLQRVERRVRAGGHFIPEDVIRRRFNKSSQNLAIIKEYVDHCYVINATNPYTLNPKFHTVSEFMKNLCQSQV